MQKLVESVPGSNPDVYCFSGYKPYLAGLSILIHPSASNCTASSPDTSRTSYIS
jgi:hypothetical protein